MRVFGDNCFIIYGDGGYGDANGDGIDGSIVDGIDGAIVVNSSFLCRFSDIICK